MNTYELILPEGYTRQPLPDKNKWTAALRGGEYLQTRGTLLDAGCKYCCLGVLSKIQGRLTEHGFDGEEDSDDPSGEITQYDNGLSEDNPLRKYLNCSGYFPEDIYVAAKNLDNPKDKSISKFNNLVDCNDNAQLTFSQIADIIDKVWYDEKEETP